MATEILCAAIILTFVSHSVTEAFRIGYCFSASDAAYTTTHSLARR